MLSRTTPIFYGDLKSHERVEEIRRLLIILTSFEMLTRLTLNLENSSLVSVGADDVIKDLTVVMGCKVEHLPIKYLGLPLRATLRNIAVWDEVLVRLEMKLALWKRRFLSKEAWINCDSLEK